MRYLSLAFLVPALLLASVVQASDAIKIGTTQSLSGHYKEFGVEQLRGLQMWAADINARGQLLGRPVELIHYDDRSRDAGSVEGMTRLIEQDSVDFLVGPYSSSLTLKASLVAEQYGIPMVSTAASSEEIWSRGLENIFGADTPAGSYVDGLQVFTDENSKTLALIYARTEFGEEVAAQVRARAGSEIVLDVGYEPERRDFSILSKQLYEIDADIILGVSFLDDSIAIVRALKQQGVKPRMLAFTVGPGLHEFGEQLGADAEGVVGIVQWLRSVREPGAQDFAYRFRQRYGYNPGIYAVLGYSAGQILEAAVRLAESTDRAAVREQLSTMYFKAHVGKYNVSETGRQQGRQNYVLQWQDGERKLVAPPKVAESALRFR